MTASLVWIGLLTVAPGALQDRLCLAGGGRGIGAARPDEREAIGSQSYP
jgi:hypothetical protein